MVSACGGFRAKDAVNSQLTSDGTQIQENMAQIMVWFYLYLLPLTAGRMTT